MVPKLHAKGSSFKGAAAYLLHDKGRAASSDRVAWTATHNLAVADPDLAWRIMAATALDQDRLKELAKVKKTGRKSDQSVLHFSLSWHPDQKPDQAEMLRAAEGAIAALKATDRQALIIAHNDEKHAHVHVLLNRVSPDDGRMLSSSGEKIELSKWAESYEKETGIYCENRLVNNEMRRNKFKVRGKKDIARNIYEQMPPREAANDNHPHAEHIQQEQRAKDAALARRGRILAQLKARASAMLARDHEKKSAVIERIVQLRTQLAHNAAREAMKPAWERLSAEQIKERQVFEHLKPTLIGRLTNKARMAALSSTDVSEGVRGMISRTFAILSKEGEGQKYFEACQKRKRDELHRQTAERERQAAIAIQNERETRLQTARLAFLQKTRELEAAIEQRRQALQERWKVRTAERTHAFAAMRQAPLRPAFEKAALPEIPRQAAAGGAGTAPSPAPALSPQVGAHLERLKARSSVSAFRDAIKGPARGPGNDPDRER